jgi:ribonuclease BN (tRNA processing enzyme)
MKINVLGGCGAWPAAEQIDAVVISHGHPHHCADLNPLLRARALGHTPSPPLPVYALPGALDAVLALDRPGMLEDAYQLREFRPGDQLAVGPFNVETALGAQRRGASHSRPEIADLYRGRGPSPELITLARGTDLLIAEATYPDHVPAADAPYLTSARQAGSQAARADAARLMLTHLWPGTDPDAARDAAARTFQNEITIAANGVTTEL